MIKKFKNRALFTTLITLVLIIVSCEKTDPDGSDVSYPYLNNGFYLLNEGNYSSGNGSLSYFSYDSSKIYNDIFKEVSGFSLGDIPLRAVENSGELFIIVNNSGKIEILDIEEGSYIGSIRDLISPRDIAFINDNEALVSSLYSDSLAIVDTKSHDIISYINIEKSSERILQVQDKIFISNWSAGNTITVLRKSDYELIKTIIVPKEPSDMVLDKDNNVRIICSGGYLNEEYPAILTIDPVALEISSALTFGLKSMYPSELVINQSRDTMYYVNGDVYMLPYNSENLPDIPFIASGSRYFYRLGFDNENNTLVITDAVDFVQKGYIYLYSASGSEIGRYKAGILPGEISN